MNNTEEHTERLISAKREEISSYLRQGLLLIESGSCTRTAGNSAMSCMGWEKRFARLRTLMLKAYSRASLLDIYSLITMENPSHSGFPNLEYASDFCDGFIKNGCIFLRCAMIPRMDLRTVSLSENCRMYTCGTDFCCRSLGAKTHELLLENPVEINLYSSATVFFLHVYPRDDVSEIPDSDNHYTRKILNSITSNLPCGDSRCRIVSDTCISSVLPSASYITLSPGKDSMPETEEVTSLWAQYSETPCPYPEKL